ncbi:MAG: ATP-binding protein [Tumebacillaceae bacterium]
MSERIIQGSLFEEDYLVRSTGNVATVPDIALTELVANAWDAGASEVHITIPDRQDGEIIVQDNGTGLSTEQFRRRWMTLGYNRLKYQGDKVEFPPEHQDSYRRAYGRNGVGRHGMLCFADQYVVETRRDGIVSRFVVAVTSGNEPFSIVAEEFNPSDQSHGTTIKAIVKRNLPNAKEIRELVSARFLHNPQFRIYVNGESIHLIDHQGLVKSDEIIVDNQVCLTIYVFDSSKVAKTPWQQGVAFWVGDRLVGEPRWNLGGYTIDGRTSFAKRHTIVVKTNDLYDHVLPDWSGFRISSMIDNVYEKVANYTDRLYRESMQEHVGKARRTVLQEHREELSSLPSVGRMEVSQFVEEITDKAPTINHEFLSAAVRAIIQLEKSRSGVSLLEKISKLSEEDIEGLDRLLDDWSVKDALTVIDEIDRRLLVIEALQRLSADPTADELKTLHPLVLQAKWLFGPEFDSPSYTSNLSLRNAFQELFGREVDKEAFHNYRNRPDIMVLGNSTMSAVCTEDFDGNSQLYQMQRILLIELKRGGFSIGRAEMNQATEYVEDLINSGHIDGSPLIHAFVVGHRVDRTLAKSKVRKAGDNETGRVEVTTYAQLVRTAEQRLFKLREHLSRYQKMADENLVQKVLREPHQMKADL